MTAAPFVSLRKAAEALARLRESLRSAIVMDGNVSGLTGSARRGTGRPVVDRFSQVLSVQYYAPDSGVFILNDGERSPVSGLGSVFELTPALYADSALAEGFERIFSSDMPGPVVFSVSLFASGAAVRETLREFVQSRSGVTGQTRLTSEA